MKHSLKSLLFAIGVLFIANSCQPKDLLPEPTMKGLNTFGCKINGKPWIPDGMSPGQSPFWKPIEVEFYRSKADTFYLLIHTSASTKDRVQLLLPKATIGVNVVTGWEPNSLGLAVYYDDSFRHFYSYGSNAGKVVITRLDTINRIISGTFEFKGQEILQKQTVSITKGRFDINLNTLK